MPRCLVLVAPAAALALGLGPADVGPADAGPGDGAPEPVAADDVLETVAGTPVTADLLANDTGEGLVLAGATGAAWGAVALGVDGVVTYTPDAGLSGPDGFDYTVADASGRTATGTVLITVLPVALDDGPLTTPAGTAVAGDVLGNDVGSWLVAATATPPAHGDLLLAPDGVFSYLPHAGFAGTDGFTYTATDGHGQSVSATATVVVTAAAAPDAAEGVDGDPVVVDPLGNDVASAGADWAGLVLIDPATGGPADVVVLADEGTWEVVNAAGVPRVRFTPVAGFTGTTTPVAYEATDTNGTAVTAVVTATYPARAGSPTTPPTQPAVVVEPEVDEPGMRIPGEGPGAPGARLADTGAASALPLLAAALLVAGSGAVVAARGRRSVGGD